MMSLPKSIGQSLLAFLLLALPFATHAADVELKQHKPFNLFQKGTEVELETVLKKFPAGSGEAVVELTDFFGETKSQTVPVETVAGDKSATLNVGVLEPGYYEVKATVTINDKKAASDRVSIAVVEFVERTAKEAREQQSRFGLKLFQIGEPGVWWRRPLIWDLKQGLDATAKLGLQWTRHSLTSTGKSSEPGTIGMLELIEEFPMNVIMKVEGIPEEAYDEKRYGPLKDFKKNNPKKAKHKWSRTTVPLKEPYQKWLREKVARIPEDQDVFEIGNEVWNYMSGKEFAEWSQMVMEVVKEMRPKAAVGVDPGEVSRPAFSSEFFAAGGMDGMDAVFVHPYTFAPEPETRTRMEIRNQRDFIRSKTGKDFDFYVTEYGWTTPPEEHHAKVNQAVTEEVQAQRTVRQSLMLYAEDMKTLIPHMMADREQVPDDWDDWFGMFRLNGQPKPVIVAHAVSARMFDSSRFVGEFYLGSKTGAMLFEREGIFTLALWSGEGAGRSLDIEVGVPGLTMVDIMGREKKVTTQNGKLTVDLSPSTVYLVGVSPDLEKQAIGREAPLAANWWWKRDGEYPLPKVTGALQIDGDLREWTSVSPVAGGKGDKTKVYLAWDDTNLYIAAEVNDEKAVAKDKLSESDRISVQIGVKPERQTDMPKKALYDYEITLAPGAGNDPARYSIANMVWMEDRTGRAGAEKDGIRIASKTSAQGWTVEAVIPQSVLEGFPSPAAVGSRLSSSIKQFDTKGKGKPEGQTLLGEGRPATWPYLILQN